MPAPYNYGFQPVNPIAELMQGIQTGYGLRAMELQRAQQQAALEQQQQYAADTQALISNPKATAQDWADYQIKYPQQREQVKQRFDMLSADDQQRNIGLASRVMSALRAGRGDVAEQVLQSSVDALKNSGAPDSQIAQQETWLKLVKENPNQAQLIGAGYLSSVMPADKVASTLSTLGQEQRAAEAQPAELSKTRAEVRKLTAEAATAEAEAPYAASNAQANAELKRADADYKRQSIAVQALNAQIARETNDVRRQELQQKLLDAQIKQIQAKSDRNAQAQGALSNIDNGLTTINQLLTHPGLDSIIGSIQGRTPNLSESSSEAQGLLDTLKSQGFLAQVSQMKGLGALTEAEGAKLIASIGNLSQTQSEESFKKNLQQISDMWQKARDRAVKQYGMQGTPEAEGKVIWSAHPKYGRVTDVQVRQWATQAGMTPEEMTQFIRQDVR